MGYAPVSKVLSTYTPTEELVRPEKFQFMEKGQNRNFNYKIVITIKNP